MYFNKNLSFKIYLEYFTYINQYGNYYHSLLENLTYPNELIIITDDEKNEDRLLYNTNFSQANINTILSWDINKVINFHFIYSLNKIVSGKKFSSMINFINHDIEDDANIRTEIFYDSSIYIKLDFKFMN